MRPDERRSRRVTVEVRGLTSSLTIRSQSCEETCSLAWKEGPEGNLQAPGRRWDSGAAALVTGGLSGRADSNRRPPAPKAGTLTKLRHAPLVRR
jgi:hypothetical protein